MTNDSFGQKIIETHGSKYIISYNSFTKTTEIYLNGDADIHLELLHDYTDEQIKEILAITTTFYERGHQWGLVQKESEIRRVLLGNH